MCGREAWAKRWPLEQRTLLPAEASDTSLEERKMSFEMKPTLELVQIVAAGGGLRLDAGMRPTLDLVQIASAAARGGARVTFSGLKARPTLDLVQIAAPGKGCVTLEG